MDDESQPGSLPLVPYPSEHREVILRHGPSVVLWDPRSRQVSLVKVDNDDPTNTICPTCHRPFDVDEEAPWSPTNYISPDYFRLLDRSRQASIQSSRSPSPSHLIRAEPSASRTFTPQHPTVEEVDGFEEIDQHTGTSRYPDASDTTFHLSSDSISPGYFKKHFREIGELGRGGFGVVLLVKHIIQDHEIGSFALKRIPVGDNSAWLAKILKEVQLLQALNHRNLVQYKHVWLEDYSPSAFAPSVPHAFILQQYCNRGDLQTYIAGVQNPPELDMQDSRGRRLSLASRTRPSLEARSMKPEEVFSFFKDITSGLGNLHENGFIHRDLKPSNCLLHESGGRLTCLVSDFGETVGQEFTRKSSGTTGTVSWCAPEVLRADYVTGKYGEFSFKSDIFSLGMILHFMAFGRLPYSHSKPFDEATENVDELRREIASWAGIQEEEFRSNLPDVLVAYLRRLLSLNPSERPGTAEILLEIKQFTVKSSERSGSFSERDRRFRATSTPASEGPERPASSRRNSPYMTQAHEESPSLGSRLSPGPARATSPPTTAASNDLGGFDLSTPRDGSLVRRRHLVRQEEPLPLPQAKDPLKLMPPPQRGLSVIFSRVMKSSIIRATIKPSIFAVKAWTIFTPCQPLAMRLIIAWPLLCLAMVDLVAQTDGIWASMVLSSIHALILVVTGRYDALCRSTVIAAVL